MTDATAKDLLTALAAGFLASSRSGLGRGARAALTADVALRQACQRNASLVQALAGEHEGDDPFLLEWFEAFWDAFEGQTARGERPPRPLPAPATAAPPPAPQPQPRPQPHASYPFRDPSAADMAMFDA